MPVITGGSSLVQKLHEMPVHSQRGSEEEDDHPTMVHCPTGEESRRRRSLTEAIGVGMFKITYMIIYIF